MKKYDYDVVVLGAGAAGLSTSNIAVTAGLRVALIEQDKMGGDCLNTGCVPSKALLHMAKKNHMLQNISPKPIDFDTVRQHVYKAIDTIAPHDSVERYEKLGVKVFQGYGVITDSHSITIDDKDTITSKYIVVATGAEPFVPPIKGLADVPYDTSDTIWQLKFLPDSMVFVGSGPIACELAQAFSRLGVKVTIITIDNGILANETPDVAKLMTEIFEKEGITIITNSAIDNVVHDGNEHTLTVKNIKGDNTPEQTLKTNHIMIATGRRAYTRDIGLEDIGVALNPNGTMKVNANLQSNISHIYGVGDVVGPYQFTHMAGHQAWYGALNIMVGRFKKFKVPYKAIPKITYTEPEVASVGDTAPAPEICTMVHYDLPALDRAIADGVSNGFVKIWVKKGSDKILGATIVAPRAGEMLAEITLAIQNDLGLNKIISTIHPYPSYSEAVKHAAVQWKKDTTAPWIMQCIRKFSKLLV